MSECACVECDDTDIYRDGYCKECVRDGCDLA